MKDWRGRVTGYALRLLLAGAAIEITAGLGTRALEAQGYFFVPPDPERAAASFDQRDPALGWLPDDLLDATGARLLPAFPDPRSPVCASLYGDSFTWSVPVDDEHAWANVLALQAGCRVTNYGVGAYGTDQALLRYRLNRDDRAPVVLLGIFSGDILRNVNSYRRLLSTRLGLGFKPRFRIDEGDERGERGELALVPIPGATAAETQAIAASPEDHLRFEYFLPGGPSGVSRREFPYSRSLLRLFADYRIRAALRGQASFDAFYDPGHPSGALAVTADIARAFEREAAGRGAFAGVLLIPALSDLRAHRRSGRFPYRPLADELARLGIPHLDTGPRFEAELAGRDPCTLYQHCEDSHFAEEGYRLLAGFVHQWLSGLGLLR